jgi:hypothetical protein
LPGSAGLVLVEGVAYLDPATAVFTAMVEGWCRQQQARGLRSTTIGSRGVLVRRFASFTNAYPWQWQPADAEDFIAGLRSACGRSRCRRHAATR